MRINWYTTAVVATGAMCWMGLYVLLKALFR
jgi:hypothetical protein